MKNFDFTDLNGKTLKTFLAILETSSVSRAADQLGVTQSAVSHTLAKLRQALGDPLFVRSGQSLTPTERALSLREPVQEVLDGLKGLTEGRPFDPMSEEMNFQIAANDLQRELIFPQMMRNARASGIRLRLNFQASGVPDAAVLRSDRCQIMLTPLPPDGPDIFQKRLLVSNMQIYYDPDTGTPPQTWEEYCEAEQVDVRFEDGRSARSALRGVDQSQFRPPTVILPHFNAIPEFIKGSNLISTDSALMALGPLSELAHAPLPFDCEPLSIFMVWHERSTADPAHRWLREQIEEIASAIQSRSSK